MRRSNEIGSHSARAERKHRVAGGGNGVQDCRQIAGFQIVRPLLTPSCLLDEPGTGRCRLMEGRSFCNLYSNTTTQELMRQLFDGVTDRAGNLAPGQLYPDQLGAIIRHGDNGLELAKARWGMPSPPGIRKTQRDSGVTNVRNLASRHWRRWLGAGNRCLVPFTSFAESANRANQWFGRVEPDSRMFFAGIEVRSWKSVRKVKDGETVDDLFAFLTCAPNAEVATIHSKAMPAILTRPEEWHMWMSAPIDVAASLQRPLPDGALQRLPGPV